MTKSNVITITVAGAGLAVSISQSCGNDPKWAITGGTPNGPFAVQVFVGGSAVDTLYDSFGSGGGSSTRFYGNALNYKGSAFYIIVTDSTTGKAAQSNTITIC